MRFVLPRVAACLLLLGPTWGGFLRVLVVHLLCLGAAEARPFLVTLSPDGMRVAIAKSHGDRGWQLFEGPVSEALKLLPEPKGCHFTGQVTYAPAADALILGTECLARMAELGDAGAAGGSGAQAPSSFALWRQPIIPGSNAPTQKLLERSLPMGNLLPLMDGSIVFMGKIGEAPRQHWPAFMGIRGWSEYQWMRYLPDGTVHTIKDTVYAFFGAASLIRDEAVILLQERRVNGRAIRPREYYVDVTPLRPGADVFDLERRGSTKGGVDEPRWQCDWAGSTCARLTSYSKKEYLAHQLQISRDDKTCDVPGLPDRIEFMSLARDGNAVAMIVRSTPQLYDYRLAVVRLGADACPSGIQHFKLP